MALEREKRVVTIHTAPVVNHTNERNSPAPNQNLYLARASIDAVFNQFLHHRSRTLDHFASRDLAGDGI